MSNKKIKKRTLKLSSQERAELALMLINSILPDKEFDSKEAWSEELRKRIDHYEQGERPVKSRSEVKKKAQALLDREEKWFLSLTMRRGQILRYR